MDAGELVSDEIVLGLIRERLGRPDAAAGFILDGYPRNVAQADALDALLAQLGQPIDAVVLMDIDPAVLIRRLTGRRSCPNCGKVFNIHTAPSHKGDRCDNCDASPLLIQRDDDREEVIERRLRVYERDTRPLIDHYRARGLLRVVEAGGPVEQVYSDFLRAAGGA
jgi:adenylate kinase